MSTSTLCILVDATEEQVKKYINFIGKVSDAVYCDNWPAVLDGLRYDEYVITRPPTVASAKLIAQRSKEIGAEIVGVFFNKVPDTVNGFDRVYAH